MRLFDENTWWQWLGEQAIRLLLGLALREIWNRLRGGRGDQGDQGSQGDQSSQDDQGGQLEHADRDDHGQDEQDADGEPGDRPAGKPTTGRGDE